MPKTPKLMMQTKDMLRMMSSARPAMGTKTIAAGKKAGKRKKRARTIAEGH